MVVVLAQTQSLFLSIQPFYIDWPFGAIDDLAFKTIDSFLGISEGPKFN